MNKQKLLESIILIMMLFVLIYFVASYLLVSKSDIGYQMNRWVAEEAEKLYLPGMSYIKEDEDQDVNVWLAEKAVSWLPLLQFVNDTTIYETQIEDEETIRKILESQANEEPMIDENGNLVGEVSEVENIVPAQNAPALDLSIEKLRDFDYLLSNFYTVDSSTTIDSTQLNVDELLAKSMKIDTTTEGPKILIFHTHSQEAFADSNGDVSTTIVGMGEYLTQLLNAKGIETLHDTGVYDLINGKLDRSNAYEYAEAAVRPILEANPTIEVVIDLHRDGVAEGTHLVTEIDGKQTAKVMFFNGLSRTRTNGDIDYLYNPYIQDNLSFSLQMQLACESMYSGFARKIYLRGYRYSLHMMPKSLLIEAGAQTNTVEEMRNAMEVLSEVLYQVLM